MSKALLLVVAAFVSVITLHSDLGVHMFSHL